MINIEETDKLIESAKDLLSKNNLHIPEYQRAYTWKKKNIVKLYEDFEDFLKSDYQHKEYYLGTILLHKENGKDRYNIIDGQQRITTLLLILMLTNPSDYQDLIFDNPASQYRIKKNYKIISEILKDKDKVKVFRDIFPKIKFTVIKTNNVDDAFTFFDTQNNRGVEPSVLVLLKAFNLRAIPKNNVSVQENCARRWVHHEKSGNLYLSEESEKLEWMIKIFFYRVRNWRGGEKADFGCYDNYRDQFTKKLRVPNDDQYKKYPSFLNQIIIKHDIEIIEKPVSNDWFDFSIRQPIYQGEGFFIFVDHYAKILDKVMQVCVYENKTFKDLVLVHENGSRYMSSFISIVTLTYYDRFGENKISQFVKSLDMLLRDIRLTKERILKQTMDIQFIRSQNEHINNNILDAICGAFDAEEVIDWMPSHVKYNYSNNKYTGVRHGFYIKHKEFWGYE